MVNFIHFLSTVLPIIAASLVIIVLLFNIYSKIRRKFSATVNCWFCNSWTKVAYDERDSFICPKCLQYNGFAKDGGYNKIIPEQHDELLNKATRSKNKGNPASNGLCALCNNNQQLKMFQLANFVPMVEEHYDVEIEHFQAQLEKAYKLCKKCDKVLKCTLEKQNAVLFGNRLKSLCKNGLSSLHNKFVQNVIKKEKQSILLRINTFLSILLAFAVLLSSVLRYKFFTGTLLKYIPDTYALTVKEVVAKITSTNVINLGAILPYFSKVVKVENYTIMCFLGILLQVILMVQSKRPTNIKLNRFLSWIILLLTSWIHINRPNYIYFLGVQVFSSGYLLYSSFTKYSAEKYTFQKSQRKAIRKFVRNLENTCSDFSDADEEFDEISSSTPKYGNSPAQNFSESEKLNHSSHWSLPTQKQGHNESTAGGVLNNSVAYASCNLSTAKSVHSQNFEPLLTAQPTFDVDINKSLNNLHLGGLSSRYPIKTPPVFSTSAVKRPRPVLSPPKLQTISQNSWLAGGFWRNVDGIIMPVTQGTNLSRSSSESSGFGSQNNENVNANNIYSLPPSRNNSFYGEFDKSSIASEPPYHFKPFMQNSYQYPSFNDPRKQVYYRSDHTFYPNLHQNNMLLIQGSVSRVTNPNLLNSRNSFQENFSFPEPLVQENEPYQRKSLFKDWLEKSKSQTSFKDLSLQSTNCFIQK